MSEIKTGGPAFPSQKEHTTKEGMTLRDYFAAKAMQGLLSDSCFTLGKDSLAKHAYQYADEMIKAREAK